MPFGITNEPRMSTGIHIAPTHRETEFEWHIEARNARRSPGYLHSGEVVNGITALVQKGLDAIEPSCRIRNFECGMWDQSERSGPHNISEVKPLKGFVVRNV